MAGSIKEELRWILCCSVVGNLIGLGIFIFFLVFAYESGEMKTITLNMYKITKGMAVNTEQLTNHIYTSFPAEKVNRLITSAAMLSSFGDENPDAYDGIIWMLENLKNNSISQIMNKVKHIAESLSPEFGEKVEGLLDTFTNFTEIGILLENNFLNRTEFTIKF